MTVSLGIGIQRSPILPLLPPRRSPSERPFPSRPLLLWIHASTGEWLKSLLLNLSSIIDIQTLDFSQMTPRGRDSVWCVCRSGSSRVGFKRGGFPLLSLLRHFIVQSSSGWGLGSGWGCVASNTPRKEWPSYFACNLITLFLLSPPRGSFCTFLLMFCCVDCILFGGHFLPSLCPEPGFRLFFYWVGSCGVWHTKQAHQLTQFCSFLALSRPELKLGPKIAIVCG